MNKAKLISATGRRATRMGAAPTFQEGLYEIATDTYAWMVPNGDWGETNLGIVQCGDTSVLIDTCWDLAHTQEALCHASAVLDCAPISTLINTHSDGDHCWGNQLFAHLPIVATEGSLKQFHQHPPYQLRALQLASSLFRKIPFANVDVLGSYMGDMLRPYRFAGVVPTPPNQTFAGTKDLQVGNTRLRLHQVGPAHTDGDCWVYLPERSVVFCGDILFVGVTPVAWAGPIENLIGALQSLLALEARVLVPGHGPLADAQDIQQQIEYWRWVQHSLTPLAKAGWEPQQATAHCLRSKDFASSPFAKWLSPERLYTSACTLYRELGIDVNEFSGALGVLNHFRKQAVVGTLG